MLKLQIGKNSSWKAPDDKCVASILGPASFVTDLESAIDSALSDPLEFPSLDQAVVPGDQVALAVDATVPQLTEVVAAVAKWLCDRGTSAENIRVVLTGEGQLSADEFEAALAESCRASIKSMLAVEKHDFDVPDRIAYVAANEASDPIYLNRTLVDADVVLPITCSRPRTALDYFGAFGIFPLLSNRITRAEFYSLPKLDEPAAHVNLQSWAQQAAWWVGIVAGIQVVPAGHGRIARIVAGQLEPVEEASQSVMSELWKSPAATSDLVVAELDGESASQSWLGVARALRNAQRFVTPHGSIVLATQLRESIGKGLARLRESHRQPEFIAKKLAADTSDDAIAAAVILNAIESHHVYLIANLPSESIESLGLGAISDSEQLTRLIEQHSNYIALEAAQFRAREFSTLSS